MIKDLKEKILNNPQFKNPDIYDEDYFSRELVSDNLFCFYNVDNINIYIDELENKDTGNTTWYLTLDFGLFKEDYESQKSDLEKIAENPTLIKKLIEFIKQESNIDLSEYNFGKPNIVLIEEGQIEIEISFKLSDI